MAAAAVVALAIVVAASCSVGNAPEKVLAGGGSGTGGTIASSGNGGGGTSASGGTGGGGSCTEPTDCPDPEEDCRQPTCEDGTCGVEHAPAGTACGQSACSGGQEIGGYLCDDNGACGGGTVVTCDPYVCDADGIACLTSCQAVADCVAEHFCSGSNTCLPVDNQGDPCSNDGECSSGFCPPDDGVCCDSACDGLCVACVASKTGGTDGMCSFVLTGTNPDGDCSQPQTCAGDGSCSCVPTGQRAPFNTRTANTTTGCVDDDPCPDDAWIWSPPYGPVFENAGEFITCSGAATCVGNVGIATYDQASACQGVWDVFCGQTLVGSISTLNQGCAGTAMTNGCSVSFAPRMCSAIRLVATQGGPANCCNVGFDSIIVAVSAW